VPADVRRNMELWVGCIAGALSDTEFASKLKAAGFTNVEVEPWRTYNVEDARAFLTESGLDADALAPQVQDKFASAFVRATKPQAESKSCCGPECCS
jgi:arsenite methyltransferase